MLVRDLDLKNSLVKMSLTHNTQHAKCWTTDHVVQACINTRRNQEHHALQSLSANILTIRGNNFF